jgi:hypothetical protein
MVLNPSPLPSSHARAVPAGAGHGPVGQGSAFTTTKSTVLLMPLAVLAAAFTDADGDALSVEVAAQPQGGKGTVSPLAGGGLQFVPPFKATGKSVFQVIAKDSSGLTSGSVPITVDMLGALVGRCWGGAGCLGRGYSPR